MSSLGNTSSEGTSTEEGSIEKTSSSEDQSLLQCQTTDKWLGPESNDTGGQTKVDGRSHSEAGGRADEKYGKSKEKHCKDQSEDELAQALQELTIGLETAKK